MSVHGTVTDSFARRSSMDVAPVARRRASASVYSLGALSAAATLTILAVPSIGTVSVPIRFGPLEGDFNVHQATIVAAAIAMVGFARRLSVTGFTATVLFVCWATALYNLTTCLFGSSDLLNPLFRGILNCALNTAVALAMAQCLQRNEWRTAFLLGVCLFGVAVASSAVMEFGFLKTSGALLATWRSIVWGAVPADRLLTAGGVTLDPSGLSRVGGLVGAPENLGYILAMTVPFVLLYGLSTARTAGIGVLYALAAAVSGSRTLAGSLLVCALFVVLRRRVGTLRVRVGIVAAFLVGLSAVLAFDINSEVTSRFTAEAFRYEFDWRLQRTLDLLNEQARSEAWVTGIGFGLGAEQLRGLAPVTTGVLGGDGAVAYTLGGIGGVAFLAFFWFAILRIRGNAALAPRARIALDLYAIVVATTSLITPVLTQVVLATNVFTILLLAFPILVEKNRP